MLLILDANPTRHLAFVTIALIAANIVVFLFWEPTLSSPKNPELAQQTLFWCHGLIPYEVTHDTDLAQGGPNAVRAIDVDEPGQPGLGHALQEYLRRKCPQKSWVASVFESMFLHAGWLHIGGNMLLLWIFGNNIEDRLRPLRYLIFYLVGGIAAAGLLVALAPGSTVPSVGASGAIAAVLGAYIVLYPRARVTTVVFFFLIMIVELPAIVVLGAWFVLQLLDGIGQFGSNVNSGVAYAAHVGGFVFGAIVGLFLRGGGRGRTISPLPPAPASPFD